MALSLSIAAIASKLWTFWRSHDTQKTRKHNTTITQQYVKVHWRTSMSEAAEQLIAKAEADDDGDEQSGCWSASVQVPLCHRGLRLIS
jgi:hypothetical protein